MESFPSRASSRVINTVTGSREGFVMARGARLRLSLKPQSLDNPVSCKRRELIMSCNKICVCELKIDVRSLRKAFFDKRQWFSTLWIMYTDFRHSSTQDGSFRPSTKVFDDAPRISSYPNLSGQDSPR